MLNYQKLNQILQDPNRGLDLDYMLEVSLAGCQKKKAPRPKIKIDSGG